MVGEVLEEILDIETVEQEKIMKTDKTNHPLASKLRVDWFIADYNLVIECDGEFHYKSISWKGESGYSNLYYRQKYDNIKNNIAKDNGWYMLRIPFWEFKKGKENIKQIITKEIDRIVKEQGIQKTDTTKKKKTNKKIGNNRKLGNNKKLGNNRKLGKKL